MKPLKLLTVISLFVLSACNNPKKEAEPEKPAPPKVIVKEAIDKSLPKIVNDPKLEKEKVVIYTDPDDETITYTKNELYKIQQLFPMINQKYVVKPSETYAASGTWKNYIDEKGQKQSCTFGSEAGQDNFYLIYAYYLKQRIGEGKYEKERKNLIELFKAVNHIYGMLSYGGTYYGHQYQRLRGDVEYSIYLLDYENKNPEYQKKYNFINQKKNYIKSLKQFIKDEESENVYNKIDLKENKARYEERKKDFEKDVALIEKLTTNYFYLNEVQKFEAGKYK